MKIRELKSLLVGFDQNIEIQINVSDRNQTISVENFSLDEEYDRDSFVLNLNLPDDMYMEEDNG